MSSNPWRKSSHSSGQSGGDCVELADLATAIGIRDSKTPETGHLALDRAALGSLLRSLKGPIRDL